MPTAPATTCRRWSAVVLALSVTAGCRSAVSTHVVPDVVDGGWNTKKLRGVPITVMVPTALEVRVLERRYFQVGADGKPTAVPDERGCQLVTRDLEYDIREKAEVFTVDARRPASGTLNYKAEFNKQYFSSFDSKVEDKTIESVTNAIKTVTGALGSGAKKGKSTAAPDERSMPYTEHLVAVRLFDIHDPCLTDAVREFVAAHVNACGPDCPPPAR